MKQGENNENINIPVFSHNNSMLSDNKEMPKIWETLTDRGATKVFLSFDIAEETQIVELTRWMDNNPSMSVFTSNKKNDYKKIDDESKKALSNMDVFVMIYSPAFASSKITNQEYGVAIARNTPVIVFINNEEDRAEAQNYGDVLIITEESKGHIAEDILKHLNTKQEEALKVASEKIPV